MRRRTCHGLSRSFGERLFGTSSTKTRPRRWLDRPSASCRRHRVTTTTTASAPAGPPAACTGSLTSLFKVRTEAGDKKPAGSLGFSARRRTISGRIGNHPERQERLKPSVRWDCPFRSEPGSALFVLLGFYADISSLRLPCLLAFNPPADDSATLRLTSRIPKSPSALI